MLNALIASIVLLFGLVDGARAAVVDPKTCAELRAEIDALQEGDTLVLKTQRVYRCSGPLVLDTSNTALDFADSVLWMEGGPGMPGIVIGDIRTPSTRIVRNIVVGHVHVFGNRFSQKHECWGGPCKTAHKWHEGGAIRASAFVGRYAEDIHVHHVTGAYARSGGFVCEKHVRRLRLAHAEFYGNYFDGLACYRTEDSVFSHIEVHHNDYAGFSFDLGFDGNFVREFVSRDNGHSGLFIRESAGNVFADGEFEDNNGFGVYFDRSRKDEAETCARETTLSNVSIARSGRAAVWQQFACRGNRLVDATFSENAGGGFAGEHAHLLDCDGRPCVGEPGA